MSKLKVNSIEPYQGNSVNIVGQISASSFVGDGSGLTGVTSYTDSDTLSYINSIGVVSGSVNWDTLIGKPSGIVSSSAQLSTEISGAFSSTSASLASDIQNNDTRLSTLEGKTLVSSSAQISYTGITDIPNGIVSSSAQLSTEISGAFSSTSSSLASRTTTLENAGYTTYTDSDTLSYINTLGVVSSSAQISITESQISDLTHYTNSDTLSYINSIGVVSGSVNWDTLIGKPSGIVSSSAQLSTEISGAFTSTSSSLASRTTTLENAGYTTYSDSNTLSYINSIAVVSGSGVARTNINNTFTGTQTFDGISVTGTGSFAYIQSVTGSAKIVGDAYIILNANTPTERYSGIKVYDSGSLNETGSLEYDSVNNHWFYESTNEGYSSGLLAGPQATRGAITWPTSNYIVKGLGSNHVGDSVIYESGSNIGIGTTSPSNKLDVVGAVSASTYYGDGSNLTGVSSYTDSNTLSYINTIGVVSSSLQIDYNSIQNKPTIPTNNNQLTNGAGYTSCTGDITGVTAGTGLSGGGTTGTVTLNINSDQRGSIVLIGQDTNDYIHVNTTAIDFRLDGNLDMRLENDGDLHVDGDVIAYSTTTSDIRFKDNINTIENSLDKIKAIRGVEFVWNAGGRKGESDLGVIAQEIEVVVPNIVREKKLPMFDDSDNLYKTVDYEKLIPLLIESVKELSYQIEHLKSSNNGITK